MGVALIRWMRVNDLSHAFILDASTIIYLFPGCILAYILSRNLILSMSMCIYIYTHTYIYIYIVTICNDVHPDNL